jgi:hypothetical protein
MPSASWAFRPLARSLNAEGTPGGEAQISIQGRLRLCFGRTVLFIQTMADKP